MYACESVKVCAKLNKDRLYKCYKYTQYLNFFYIKLTSAIPSHTRLNTYLHLILCIYELTIKII